MPSPKAALREWAKRFIATEDIKRAALAASRAELEGQSPYEGHDPVLDEMVRERRRLTVAGCEQIIKILDYLKARVEKL